MTIRGVARNEKIILRVFRDCNDNFKPDFSEDCPPLWEGTVVRRRGQDYINEEIELGRLKLPREKPLWLGAFRRDAREGRLAFFSITGDNPCSVLQTLVRTFIGGDCRTGLTQSLFGHLGPAGLEAATFEVRRLLPDRPQQEPEPLPGTRGATGLALLDPEHLLVTVAPAANALDDPVSPALLAVSLNGGPPRLLWRPPDGTPRFLNAPLALPAGEIAFVHRDPDAQTGILSILNKKGKRQTEQDLALDYPIFRLAAYHPEERAFLALTPGHDLAAPAFLRIERDGGAITWLGYHHPIYHAFTRSPKGGRAAIAMEDVTGNRGWDLYLVDDAGKSIGPLQAREPHDLMPLWHPDGRQLFYLAESNP